MPWSGSAGSKSFSRNNGTHTGSQVWQEDAAEPVDILANRHDIHDQDFATALNLAFCKDGGNTATADLPMGGFTLSNIDEADARTEPARFSDVQDNKGQYIATVGGTVNVITLTPSIPITAYAAGQRFTFVAVGANTGAVTVSVSGVGFKDLLWPDATALENAELPAGSLVDIEYDGTRFQLHGAPRGTAPVGIGVGTVMAWPGTASVPSGWLECDGSSIAVATYPALHAALGYAYGGSGANFTLPNYKDYFLRGFDASGTDAGSRTDRGDGTTGASIGTKQDHALDEHTHALGTLGGTAANHGHPYRFSSATDENQHTNGGIMTSTFNTSTQGAFTGTPSDNTGQAIGGSGTLALSLTGSVANTGGSETRPKNITVKWIILALRSLSIPVSAIGKNATGIGARLMTSRATNGADAATFDSGSNDITLPVFDFDDTTQQYVHIEWMPPKRWNRGTVSFEALWTNASGLATETLVLSLAGVAISNDDPLNATFGTAQTVTDTWIAQGDKHRSPESAAITIGGTPAEGDLIVFQLSRVVGSDNLTGDARLIAIRLFWNSDATTDD